jgi:lysophospholipase L1-like esterase
MTAIVLAAILAAGADGIAPMSFAFGPGPAPAGAVTVPPDLAYDPARGYGFEPGGPPARFSVAVPEGNYLVAVTVGDPAGPSDTTVRAEVRRLMLEDIATAAGATATRTFAVSVRTPAFPGGAVRLKPRERAEEWANWDDKLTLEFAGRRPRVRAVEVRRADLPTVYLLGDSTVCDQPGEPYASWGQMLPRFFGPTVAVANHAQSGESLRSAAGARRLDKVLADIKPGDTLLIQFGHNDMKQYDAATYRAELKRYVAAARAKGAAVALVTPMHRRTFAGRAVTNSHRDYPDAVRAAAAEDGVPLIDLHAMSKALYEALGPDGSGALFKAGDGTHHSPYGAYELARCVVEGIRANKLDLAKHLAEDAGRFDPAKPDPPGRFAAPAGPAVAPPDGK